MLNYDTLLSNYDDRLTLLEYLKKVEAALADASATSFSVTKTGNATIKFVLTFADGSTLESPEIVLQQGESVASAAIVNGHLILTLTNGDELDAGNMFNGNVSITGNLDVAGDINGVKIESIKDENGHNRFIEFAGVPMVNAGFTASYCRCSLSGTHLMFVLAGSFDNGAEVARQKWASVSLPSWITSKIFPVFASSRISVQLINLYGDDWTQETTKPNIVLTINGSNLEMENVSNAFNTSKARYFRIQFDLLIDAE